MTSAKPKKDRFRILSLDGGGIKGAFTASVIATLDQMVGGDFAMHFDLITGTSTGGLIALGLGLGKSPAEIRDFYISEGPELFGYDGVYQRLTSVIRDLFSPKHSSERLSKGLQAFFGDRLLGHSSTRLIIPSFDCVDGSLTLFKTAHHPRFVRDYLVPAYEVGLATSAAPTYFKAAQTRSGRNFIDGGVWANSPVVVGILEAIHLLDKKASEIDVLSIGTTDAPFSVGAEQRAGGKLDWSQEIVPLLMHAQMKTVEAQAGFMTDQRLVRINPVAEKGRFSLNGVAGLEDLVALGESVAARTFQEPAKGKDVHNIFFSSKAQPFRPYHLV